MDSKGEKRDFGFLRHDPLWWIFLAGIAMEGLSWFAEQDSLLFWIGWLFMGTSAFVAGLRRKDPGRASLTPGLSSMSLIGGFAMIVLAVVEIVLTVAP